MAVSLTLKNPPLVTKRYLLFILFNCSDAVSFDVALDQTWGDAKLTESADFVCVKL